MTPPPDNREARTIAAVACPLCGAGVGVRCTRNAADSTPIERSHQERRWAWQQARGPVNEAPARTVCDCGHSANRHGSERVNEYGCDRCDCPLTREAVRARAAV